MAKGRPTLKRRAPRAPRSMAPATDPALMLAFVVEMNHLAEDVFSKLGVTPAEQRKGAVRAAKDKKRTRPSAKLIARITGAGNLVSTWRRDRRYRGRDGFPRVLEIRGKGATFETLARKCVPEVPMAEVLDYICSHGEAAVYQKDKVALLGSGAVLTKRTPEITAAWLLTQFRHLAQTILYNASFPADEKGVGLFQRQVGGYLSQKDFRLYAQGVRPKLQEMCEQLEAGLSLNRRSSGSVGDREDCGVSIFVYRNTKDIG
jgi:hypothetical protein